MRRTALRLDHRRSAGTAQTANILQCPGRAGEHRSIYRKDLWIDQGVHVEVWSEKDAIRGVISPVTTKYDVPLMISRGYSSETFLWETAEDINDEGCPAVIYQLGDHDPTVVGHGIDIQRKLREFVDDDID